MILPTLVNFDTAIETVTRETSHAELNIMLQEIGDLLKHFKQGQLALINELLAIYDSASEHNVDVGRHVLFELAQRLTGAEPPQEPTQVSKDLSNSRE